MFRCLESVLPQSGMQLDTDPSPPSPRCAEQESEPTTDGEPEPAVTDEPSANGATELRRSYLFRTAEATAVQQNDSDRTKKHW